MSKIIVLMGAPGAGKGTQARLLQERLGLPQISTGDILRARAQGQDLLGREIRAVQDSGKLASDDLVDRVVQERTAEDDCRHGYVLDGFGGIHPFGGAPAATEDAYFNGSDQARGFAYVPGLNAGVFSD